MAMLQTESLQLTGLINKIIQADMQNMIKTTGLRPTFLAIMYYKSVACNFMILDSYVVEEMNEIAKEEVRILLTTKPRKFVICSLYRKMNKLLKLYIRQNNELFRKEATEWWNTMLKLIALGECVELDVPLNGLIYVRPIPNAFKC